MDENKQVKDRRHHPARLTDAKSFMASFVDGYNHEHRHTRIGLKTPADVHSGLAAAKAI
ncbi:transposase [Cryobacterium sp. Y82]|uniref:transposase n=1 Tax=Cryobacterium sp. Y82 TaxID=2045017 RepID=UPI0011B064D0|nr:transposase [Cryobacterium sp. Y82]